MFLRVMEEWVREDRKLLGEIINFKGKLKLQ